MARQKQANIVHVAKDEKKKKKRQGNIRIKNIKDKCQ